MLAFASRASMYLNVALGVVGASVFPMSQTSSQARVFHGFESSRGLKGASEEGSARQGDGVPQGVVVGHDVGARMGDANEEVLVLWSSMSFASATLSCRESVTM